MYFWMIVLLNWDHCAIKLLLQHQLTRMNDIFLWKQTKLSSIGKRRDNREIDTKRNRTETIQQASTPRSFCITGSRSDTSPQHIKLYRRCKKNGTFALVFSTHGRGGKKNPKPNETCITYRPPCQKKTRSFLCSPSDLIDRSMDGSMNDDIDSSPPSFLLSSPLPHPPGKEEQTNGLWCDAFCRGLLLKGGTNERTAERLWCFLPGFFFFYVLYVPF